MKRLFCFITLLTSCYFLNAQTDLVVQNRSLPKVGKTFSVVVHIVADSTKRLSVHPDTIKKQVSKMNAFFTPISVGFEVCKVDTIFNYKFYDLKDTMEYQEMLNQHRVNNRINMFVLNSYNDGELFGFAAQSGITQLTDGAIVLHRTFANAGVMAHLMGHYFGLDHTFETKGELVDGSNCATTGDKLCDTPADPYEKGDNVLDYINAKCEFINTSKDAKNQYYVPDVGNIMSYYYPCFCSFSQAQLRKMATTYLSSSPKMW